MCPLGINGEGIHGNPLEQLPYHVRKIGSAFRPEGHGAAEHPHRPADQRSARQGTEDQQDVCQSQGQVHFRAAVDEHHQTGEDVGEANKIEVIKQKLKDQIHGPQEKTIKLPVDHPVAQTPGLDEEHHRQTMAQHRHAVQKRQTFVSPAADAAELVHHEFDGGKAYHPLDAVGQHVAGQHKGVFQSGLDGLSDRQSGYRGVISYFLHCH